MKINADASALLAFVYLINRFLKISERPFSLGNLPLELVRFEGRAGAAGAGELLIALYPSDSFLRLAAAAFAGDFNFSVIQESGHAEPSLG